MEIRSRTVDYLRLCPGTCRTVEECWGVSWLATGQPDDQAAVKDPRSLDVSIVYDKNAWH